MIGPDLTPYMRCPSSYLAGERDERARILARLANHLILSNSEWHVFCSCGWEHRWKGDAATGESMGAWLDHALGVEEGK